jgi:hypothetical protein
MTVTSSVNKRFYTGNGSVTTFAINSLSGDVLTGLTIFDDDDVKVYLDGVLKTKTTHYTISSSTPPASFAGKLVNANVVFLTAPANGVAVAIVREIPVTQELLLSNGNNVPPKPLESQLDKMVVQNQQLAGSLGVDVVRVNSFESASGINPILLTEGTYLKCVGGQITNATPVAVGVDISNATVTQVATNTSDITALDGRLNVLEPLKNPALTGNALKIPQVNAGETAYGAVTFDALLPSQTGNSGKLLTTNGTNASWLINTGAFAYVNFDGTTASNLVGTATRASNIATINATAHGHIVGHRVYLTFASGISNGWFTVATVPTANSFTVASTGADVVSPVVATLTRRSIRKALNVQSVPIALAGAYAVNFTTPAPDANYALLGSAQNRSGSDLLALVQFHWNNAFVAPTVNYVHAIVRNSSTAFAQDMTDNSIVVFA